MMFCVFKTLRWPVQPFITDEEFESHCLKELGQGHGLILSSGAGLFLPDLLSLACTQLPKSVLQFFWTLALCAVNP